MILFEVVENPEPGHTVKCPGCTQEVTFDGTTWYADDSRQCRPRWETHEANIIVRKV